MEQLRTRPWISDELKRANAAAVCQLADIALDEFVVMPAERIYERMRERGNGMWPANTIQRTIDEYLELD